MVHQYPIQMNILQKTALSWMKNKIIQILALFG